MKFNPKLLFRPSYEFEDELHVASQYFNVITQRSLAEPGDYLFGRYSVLPFYKELENDLTHVGARLANSHAQHRWIANFDYYEHVKPYTFETWFDLTEIPDCKLVVKGRTNSRKARWNTQMFCENRRDAILLATELMQDPLLQEQGIIVRRYEELELLEIGLNGQPFVNEHRLFYWGPERIAHGFYWSQSETKAEIDRAGLDFADFIATTIVMDHVNFFVLDIAKTAKGEWKLVEINDGQMSGLSCIDPHDFYSQLAFFAGAQK